MANTNNNTEELGDEPPPLIPRSDLGWTEPPTKRLRKEDCEEEIRDFFFYAGDIQNMIGDEQCLLTSDLARFRVFFGVHVEVAIFVWHMLIELDLLPHRTVDVHHLLWALHYMFEYPKTKTVCALLGGKSHKAIDPKTLRKYVWPLITAIATLEPYVIIFENRHKKSDGPGCNLSNDGVDCQAPDTAAISSPTRTAILPFGTKYHCASRPATFVGSMVRFPQEHSLTSISSVLG